MDGDDFRQWADRESTRFAVEHSRCPLGRSEQGESVFGEGGRRPELAACFDGRGTASITQPQNPGPVTSRASVIDHPDQPVQINSMNQPIQIGISILTHSARLAHTIGQG